MRKGSDSSKEIKCNVRVCVRCRPLSNDEKNAGFSSIIKHDGKSILCRGKAYGQFDEVFDSSATQKAVFDKVVRPQIDRVLAGFNCTVFAYGQTGTGKTYTMEGGREDAENSDSDPTTGMTPRAVETIFLELEKANTEEFTVRVSFVELYNEELYDLLAPNCDDRERLRLYDDPSKKGAVVVSGAEEIPVRNRQEVYDLMKRGAERRITAATLMNRNSSRSHSIFTVTVIVRESNDAGEELVKTGKLNLVDLAGSENIGRSGADGKRAKEAGNINQSLLTLGRVITALTSSAPHVPYRESKLTRMLQDSLGGTTITSLIATISPASSNFEETASTLDYAMRAKNIKNHPECNQKVSRKALLKEYNAEIEKLRRDLFVARQKTGGVYISTESYEDMERQLNEKEEAIHKLSEDIEVYATKMQQFMKDMEEMDDHYKSLYMLNTRFRSKLANRVEELDETTKNLYIAEQKLNAYIGAFKETYGQAKTLFRELQLTREAVKSQMDEAERWWSVEDELVKVDGENEKMTENFVNKISHHMPEVDNQLQNIISMISNYLQKVENKIAENGTSTKEDIRVAHGTLETIRELSNQFKKEFTSILTNLLNDIIQSTNNCSDEISRYVGDLRMSTDTVSSLMLDLGKAIQSATSTLMNAENVFQKDIRSWIQDLKENLQKNKIERETHRTKFETDSSFLNENVLRLTQELLGFINRRVDVDNQMIQQLSEIDIQKFDSDCNKLDELSTVVQSFDDNATENLKTIENNMREIESRNAHTKVFLNNTYTNVLDTCVNFTKNTNQTAATNTDSLKTLLDTHANIISEKTTIIEDAGKRMELTVDDFVLDAQQIAKDHMENLETVKNSICTANMEVTTTAKNVTWKRRNVDVKPPARHHPELDTDMLTEPPLKQEKILENHGLYHEMKMAGKTRESLLDVANIPPSPSAINKRLMRNGMDNISEETEN